MLILVGLGNIGEEYANTYHNMGFLALDEIANRLGMDVRRAECQALTALKQKDGEKIILAKPTTYMNLSGVAVKSLLAKYGAEPKDLIVFYDDIDIDRFSVRARAEGSAGTHNGMRNIVAVLGCTDIKRVRIGVGKGQGELKDYVLSKIRTAEKDDFKAMFARIADGVMTYLEDGDFEKMQRELNAKG